MVEATKQTGRRVEPPANWDILSANEPGDEKLDEWGWDRITSGQKKTTGKNDGYFYISPKAKKRFRSKKKAKMFGLIVEYLDGSEHNAYDYIMQNTQLFNNFFWKHPLKKNNRGLFVLIILD